jgi:hypothetical protein
MKKYISKILIILGSLLFLYVVFLNTIHFSVPKNLLTSGYKSPDPDKMHTLIVYLNEEKIPFIVDVDGFIKYEQSYKDRVWELIEKIEGTRFGTMTRKYDNENHNEIFKDVLTHLNIDFVVDKREDGDHIAYDPGNITDEEINSMMNEFVINRMGAECENTNNTADSINSNNVENKISC